MNELTEGFRLFRELARAVWNCGLRLYPDGEHEFVFVEDTLFTAMVLSQANETLEKTDVGGIRYYPQLKVVTTRQQRATALVGYEEDNFIRWKPEEITDSSDLRFGSLFDWDTLSGSYRDFRYIFCADVVDIHSIRRIVIDAHDVELTEVTGEQPVNQQNVDKH